MENIFIVEHADMHHFVSAVVVAAAAAAGFKVTYGCRFLVFRGCLRVPKIDFHRCTKMAVPATAHSKKDAKIR